MISFYVDRYMTRTNEKTHWFLLNNAESGAEANLRMQKSDGSIAWYVPL